MIILLVYHDSPQFKSKKVEGMDASDIRQNQYKFSSAITLPKGDTFCSALVGSGDEIQFCLSRKE